ncbi:MAG: fluoride efflux transporter CrcB [Verrucomicrobiota bacterium]
MQLIWIALGGAAGAVCRALASHWIPTEFPWATLLVNVVGSFIIGLVFGLEPYLHLSPHVRVLLTAGFCGALTTFSTFSYQTLALFEKGDIAAAAANIALNLILTLVAVWSAIKLAAVVGRA